MAGIGRLGAYAIDCPNPRELAAFYGEILGVAINEEESEDDWVELSQPVEGAAELAFQYAAEYAPPKWPGAEVPQQAHLDFYVPDLDEGERQVLKLGATKAEYQPGTTFRVFLDPVGHPFCLCQG
jgi:catechol 2,3-dioxygenase-like lactoylglutathione lyase family enzyme